MGCHGYKFLYSIIRFSEIVSGAINHCKQSQSMLAYVGQSTFNRAIKRYLPSDQHQSSIKTVSLFILYFLANIILILYKWFKYMTINETDTRTKKKSTYWHTLGVKSIIKGEPYVWEWRRPKHYVTNSQYNRETKRQCSVLPPSPSCFQWYIIPEVPLWLVKGFLHNWHFVFYFHFVTPTSSKNVHMADFPRIRLLTGLIGNSLWNAHLLVFSYFFFYSNLAQTWSTCVACLTWEHKNSIFVKLVTFICAVSQLWAESVGRAGKQISWRVEVDEQKFVKFFDDYVKLTGV